VKENRSGLPATPRPFLATRWLTRMAVAAVLLLLGGCSAWLGPLLNGETPTVETSTPTIAPVTGETGQTPTNTPEQVSPIQGAVTITIWLPPQFNPEGGTPAGDVLMARLDRFMEENPGILVAVRIKAASGPGGMLESLTAASSAAPGSLPAVAVLNRTDLEAAALKGLVLPLDGISSVTQDSDWYAYAKELGRVQNSTFGLPFAGDALLLVNRMGNGAETAAPTWSDIFATNQVVIFPADDSQALVTLALYRSAGGLVQDLQGRPTLDPEFLQQVLQNYKDGIGQGAYPSWLTQLQTPAQGWQAFSEARGDWVVTWSSNYLADLPPDASAVILPSLGSDPFTLATGWSWTLTDTDPLRRETSVKLMEFLSDSEFLADLTLSAGYLPTRPTALASWSNASLQPIMSQVVLAAEVRPANELLASLGPVMREAVLAVFNGQQDPAQAAKAAAERLGNP